MDSEFSESRSQKSEFRSEARGRAAGGRLMSSVLTIRELTRDVGNLVAPDAGWKKQVSRIHDKLTDPKFEWRLESLSWSRVKAWYFSENRRIDYEERRALEELRANEEYRRARVSLAATAQLLATHLEQEGAPLDGDQIRALGRLAGQVDLPGRDAR